MPKDTEFHAIKLERAKEDLEKEIEQAIRVFEHRTDGPVAVNIDFDSNDSDNEHLGKALRASVRSFVKAFHAKPVVKQTGVRVHHVTAFDSDADGTIAVDVKYEYPR